MPFIPPPDYPRTIKKGTASRRPTITHQAHVDVGVGVEPVAPQPAPRRRGPHPHHPQQQQAPQFSVFKDFNNVDHIVDLTNGQVLSTIPDAGDDDMTELSLEDKEKQKNQRVLKMLQTQGVPVFPGLAPSKKVAPKPAFVPPAHVPTDIVHMGPTRAYIKHLENHSKYDTLNSFQSCDNCPICKQMLGEIEILSNAHAKAKGRTGHQESLITSGKAFVPMDIMEEEPEDYADDIPNPLEGWSYPMPDNYPSTSHQSSLDSRSSGSRQHSSPKARHDSHPTQEDTVTARARYDWQAEGNSQLSIKYGETLYVTQLGQDWIRCKNGRHESGWVPANQLYLMPTGNY